MSNADFLKQYYPYQCLPYSEWDYSVLRLIPCKKSPGRTKRGEYADCWIMLDTETSKERENEYTTEVKNFREQRRAVPVQNYIVAFSLSIRAFGQNIVTLYGHDPLQCMDCLQRIRENTRGELYIYVHNLSYDWHFLRQFMFDAFGLPDQQLNTKPHYPIMIRFENGITLRDSLILAQRKLEKWAADMGVEHQKAVGSWDYNRIRHQLDAFTAEEITYIEHDTLAGVECLDAMAAVLHKRPGTIPLTATGVPREQLKRKAIPKHAHDEYLECLPTWEQQCQLEMVYHGGFTHANRYHVGAVIDAAYIKGSGFRMPCAMTLQAHTLILSLRLRILQLHGERRGICSRRKY